MKPIFLCLEDGAVFEGRSISEALECSGLLSFYTGVVGYQEVITDPANLGKIIVFTYPLIGNYGINPEDAESASPKVAGIICKEYPPYYSNFRATGSLKDYLESFSTSPQPAVEGEEHSYSQPSIAERNGKCAVVFGHEFDTRAILLHLRENGEMKAVITPKKLSDKELADRISRVHNPYYEPENRPEPCDNPKVNAAIMDLGASRSFFRRLSALGVKNGLNPNDAELIIISDAPYYTVEDDACISQVAGWLGKKPVIGFGHGSAIVAKAAGGRVRWMKFGDHGLNIPVKYVGGGRNEITIQNHNYEVLPDGDVEALFINIHDGTCEGFKCNSIKAAGINFLPNERWFNLLLDAVGLRTEV